MAAVDRDVNGQRKPDGVPASLQQATMDSDLYGNGGDRFAGYERSIGPNETDDAMDEMERTVLRYFSALSALFSLHYT